MSEGQRGLNFVIFLFSIFLKLKDNGLGGVGSKILEALQREMKRIEKLPQEQQAEEIGNIAGNVIAMVGAGGLGIKVASKLSKLKKATTFTEKATKVSLMAADGALNGIAETAFMKGFPAVYKKLFSKISLEEIAKLNDIDRVKAGEYFLGRELTSIEQEALIKAHNVGNDRPGAGLYKYTDAEKQEKYTTLANVGFSKDEIKELMDKGVCGKLPEKVAKIDLPAAKADIEDLVKLKKEAEKKGLKLEIDPKRIEKAFEALKQVGLPENYLKLVRGAGIDDISTLAHYRSWLIDGKIRQHIEAVAEKRGLTPTEAHTIFGYTKGVLTIKIDGIRTENVNAFLRGKLPKDLPESQTKAIKEIIENFDKGLDKMPDIEGNMVIRGDSWDGWRVPKGSEVDLYGYTSCARKKENTFIGEKYPKNDLFIEVEIIKGRAKDISELAYYTHFLGETTEEALILRNSKVVIKDIQEGYDKFTKKTGEVVDITKIKVEQIK